MKAYVISLPRSSARRASMTEQRERTRLDYEALPDRARSREDVSDRRTRFRAAVAPAGGRDDPVALRAAYEGPLDAGQRRAPPSTAGTSSSNAANDHSRGSAWNGIVRASARHG